ncbi:DUF3348 family protein [Hydrogenophaga sp. PBL-H3]|uniref:DUF3348 family protein n=1 Tax=Hydrogenophaga sp. PBL-H3 TaxID=434010 RepID=UPI00131FEC10|nr:DUF3348 family protein [Hydrogenophaga sp. PBL-H3]QHE77407.1 DUF3348 domain-containing protein [Hydrogenophaga sp. PBL-H3]QHE81831.1 DUF3348 domain-containing protein [Hydrogenophaga sp. PBL-H3]
MRSNFNRSALVRQLAGWQPTPAEVSRQDLAERLGHWLNVADAIALSSLHQALPAVARARRPAVSASASSVQAELQRVRATLSQAITAPPGEPGDEPADDADASFALHHQRCLEQQRRMEMSVDALRGHVRKTLSQTSPRLAQLAALDAVLDPMLGGREQKLLSTVPVFLKARFDQLRQTHPGGWQPLFEHELQQTLLAELDLRLQPVAGMVEALGQEVKQHP